LALAMAATISRAQVNIDQGKTPAEVYANDCGACHKTPRGLAAGKNSLMLSSFLREHYTASREQAAALAAYVLGAGGAQAAPPTAKPKPETEHARAEEPKAGESKPETHPAREVAKPEREAPATAKLQRPEEETKPEERAKREPSSGATASRGEKKEHEEAAPAHEAAPAAVTPADNIAPSNAASSPAETPAQEISPTKSASAPTESEPGDNAPVPRDNIPD
jgi:hypothetical protein